jgi:Domain of unknown function (DUF6443)
MNKYFYFLAFLYLPLFVFAQNTAPNRTPPIVNPPTYEESFKFNQLKNAQKSTSAQASTLTSIPLTLKNYPAGSPEVVAASRFKDVPVNLNTGTYNVPIPLYTLSEGPLSVPVSLVYNGSGLKNAEVPTWAGAGWNLFAGGSITRMVRDEPDEGHKIGSTNHSGYFSRGITGNNSDLKNDNEPDYFFLDIGGQNYKFAYRYYGENAKFETFPISDIKIEVAYFTTPIGTTQPKFNGFVITMPDGTVYTYGFGNEESTVELEAKKFITDNVSPATYWQSAGLINAWYLKKINTPYGQEINFDYDYVNYSYFKLAENGKASDYCPTAANVTKEINRVFVQSVALSAIRGVNTKIEFNKRTKVCAFDPDLGKILCTYPGILPRYDLDNWAITPQSQSSSKRLDEMTVMENTALPKDTLKYNFTYGYLEGNTNTEVLPTGYTSTHVGNSSQKRLKLERISFPDNTKVRFRYRNDDPGYIGKNRLSYGVDHWGYPNGFDGNRTATGLIGNDGILQSCTGPSALSNRETDISFSFYGSLDSIIYEKRKTVKFNYELHNVENYKNGVNYVPFGGPRIKSIIYKDIISNIETKSEYEYTLANGLSSGILKLKPIYKYKSRFDVTGVNSGLYNLLLGELSEPLVSYSRVIERNSSLPLSNGLGKTISYFSTNNLEYSIKRVFLIDCVLYPLICGTGIVEVYDPTELSNGVGGSGIIGKNFIENNQLLRSEVFNQNNDTLSINENQYFNTFTYGTSTQNQYTGAKVMYLNGQPIGTWNESPSNNNFVDYYLYYKQEYTTFRIKKQTQKTFSQAGLNPVISTQEFFYKDEAPLAYQTMFKGKHQQPIKTTTTSGRGIPLENNILYTGDFFLADTTIYVGQSCTDDEGRTYDCSYSTVIPHATPPGSRINGIKGFLDYYIKAVPVESYKKEYNSFFTGAEFNQIGSFTNPIFPFGPKKSFAFGNVGSVNFAPLQYIETQNDTIKIDTSYYETGTVLAINPYGMPTQAKAFGGPVSETAYDASNLLPIRSSLNITGLVSDTSLTSYKKKLFGPAKIIGVNKLSKEAIYDTTFKKGMVKRTIDKDGYIRDATEYRDPGETLPGINTDITKIRSFSFSPRIASTSVLPISTGPDSVNVSIGYSDASGRGLQSKALAASPTKKDIIGSTPIFDAFGRPQKNILAIPVSTSSGLYETNITAQAQTFYNDTAPFSEVTLYEASPLSRAFKSIGPGAAFRPSRENIQNTETGNFSLNKYSVSVGSFILNIAPYVGNQIVKNTSTDVQGNKSISFTDRDGLVVESHVQFTGDGTLPSHYLKTQYVYDDIGRMVALIPPLLYGQVTIGTDMLTSPMRNLLYLYKYDRRGRQVEVHRPDAGWAYGVFNRLGQTVLTQNSLDRESNRWHWNKYDQRGAIIQTGIMIQTTYTREQMQILFDRFTEPKQYEEFSATAGAGIVENYTTRSFPGGIQSFIIAANIKTVNFYDTYIWNTNTGLNFIKYQANRWPNSKGLMTGSKVRRLDTNAWLTATMYYDDQNRLIQGQSENRFGAINQTDMVLDFIGQLKENRAVYRKPAKPTLTISTVYKYDHTGRKILATHYFNGRPEPLASFEYDELGRIKQKNLNQGIRDSIIVNTTLGGSMATDVAKDYILFKSGTFVSLDSVYEAFISTGFQNVSYHYNVRSQLRGINLTPTGALDGSKVFAMKLDYHEDNRFYNGLISNQKWKNGKVSSANADTVTRTFTYNYDKVNRLTQGTYAGKSPENHSVPKIRYDVNGNIDSLQRNGLLSVGTYGLIDNLKYNYAANSNKLNAIDDAASATLGFTNTAGATDYTYYTDGGLKTDNNKGITRIAYNYMGLIDTVYFGASKKIIQVYTADGLKLSTKYINGAVVLNKEYVGELIYINDTLRSAWHDEGRIVFNNTGQASYQFFISDHQGSVRVVMQKQADSTYIAQQIYYGVTGDIIANTPGGQNLLTHLYQGKDWQDGFGYDFVTRTYDPYTVRFLQVDGANQFASGYTGMGNMPNVGVDPDGQVVVATAVLIGSAIGAFSGWQLGKSMGAKGWGMAGYIVGGAAVGAISGGFASGIATSGVAYANTLAIVGGSFTNSIGMSALSGQDNVSVSFGAASYNFSNNEWGYLGKKGNSRMENLGYALGAMANVQDIFAGNSGGSVDAKARKKVSGHAWIEGEDINISVGPGGVDLKPDATGIKWESQYLFKTVEGENFITKYNPNETFSTKINNVNVSKLKNMTNFLNKGKSLSGNHGLKYGVWNGCVNQTSRALFRSGVLNLNTFLPITSPVLLNAELAARNYGMMFSYIMTSKR